MTDARAVTWHKGGSAVVIEARGVYVTVESTQPFPPGAPVAGTLEGENAKGFTLKVANTRSVRDGTWEVRGRLVSATSDVIAAFAAATSST